MPLISLQDQGFYQPGNVINDSVAAFVQDQQRRQNLAQQAQQFQTEQAVRQAQAQPQIDPNVIAQNVQAARARALIASKGADYVAGMSPALADIYQKQGPAQFSASSQDFGPNGRQTDSSTNLVQSGTDQQGNPIYALYGGKSSTGLPPTSTALTIGDEKPGAIGLAPVTEKKTYVGDDGKVHTLGETQTPMRTGRSTFQQGMSGMAATATATMADPNATDQDKAAAKAYLEYANKFVNKATTAPPAKDTRTDLQKQTDEVLSAQQDLENAKNNGLDQNSPAVKTAQMKLDQAQTNLNDLRRSKYAPKKTNSLDAELGLAAGVTPNTAANANPQGMPGSASMAPGGGPRANGSTPPASLPAPQSPGSTPNRGNGNPNQNFTVGTVYKDKNGNRAKWNGTGFDPVQ